MKKKKIVVTGSSGVLGSSFKKKTFLKKNKNYKFIFLNSKNVDLRSQKKTLLYFKKINPDFIIHLAAVSGGIGLSSQYQATLLRDNILMTFNILEAARSTNVKKIVMTLTTGMYPEKAKTPYKEKNIHDGYPLSNNYGSSFAKRIIDPAIKAYRDQYGMDVIGLIVPGIFGENDNFNLSHSPMLPANIHKIFLEKKNNTKLKVWGDGSPLREYIFSEDLRDVFMWALKKYSSSDCLNVSSGQEYSIKSIIYKICDILKFNKKNIIFEKKDDRGIKRKNSDIKKFKKLAKMKFTPFNEGLQKTVIWFVNNYQNKTLRLGSKINEKKIR